MGRSVRKAALISTKVLIPFSPRVSAYWAIAGNICAFCMNREQHNTVFELWLAAYEIRLQQIGRTQPRSSEPPEAQHGEESGGEATAK